MSLTSLLASRKDFRHALRDTLTPPPAPIFPVQMQLPLTTNYGTVGTGFDYLLRALLERGLPAGQVQTGALVAGLAPHMSSGRRAAAAARSLELAEQVFRAFISNELPIGRQVARACLVLAKLEAVLRSGELHYLDSVEEIAELDIQDLLALLDLVPLEQFNLHRRLVLNPVFKLARLVGGADADLLLDDTLIEIKTTKIPKLTNAYLYQLVGYLLLNNLGGIRDTEETPIRRLGVYFARHGLLHTFSVADLFSTGGYDDLQLWFALMLNGKENEQPDLSVYRFIKEKAARRKKTVESAVKTVGQRRVRPPPATVPITVVDYADYLAASRRLERERLEH